MTTPEVQLFLRFEGIRVLKLNFLGPLKDTEESEDLEIKIGFETEFSENDDKEFVLLFNMLIQNKEKSLVIDTSVACTFKTSDTITDKFKNSDWTKINAPAIAFPYIRSFISTVSINAGYHPIILPSFNFTKMKKEEESKQKDKE